MSKALCAAHPLLAPHTRGQGCKRAAETESLGFVLRVMDSESSIDTGNTAVAALQTSLFTQECMNVCSACCPVFLNDNFAILCGTLGTCLPPPPQLQEIVCGLPGQDRALLCHTKSSHYLAPPSPDDHFSFPQTRSRETLHPFWLDLKA